MNKFISATGCFVVGTLSILCLFLGASTWAADDEDVVKEPGGIQMSPARFDLALEAGATREIKINMHNYDDIARDVAIDVEDFFVVDDTMEPQFFVPSDEHPRKTYDVIDWIDVPDNFIIEGNTSRDIYFNLHIPENQPTSGYYGAIFFKTRAPDREILNEDGSNSAKIMVNYRVGTLFTFAVQGDEPMMIDGGVSEFDTTEKVFWDSPIEFFAKLYSTGNIHYKIKEGGQIEIKRFGKKFSTIILEPRVLYPDRTRTFKEKVPTGPWDYGVYSATLNMESEDGSVKFSDEISQFVVIPWKTTALLGGGLFVMLFCIWFFKKYMHFGVKLPKEKKDK